MAPAVWTLDAAARVPATVQAFLVHYSLRVQGRVRAGCMVDVGVRGGHGSVVCYSLLPPVCM